jgi:hypothetical protein
MVEPTVGCRVRILKDLATVRYVGPVDGQTGNWVGVEWDDASRGKHDGSTGGRRYFNCEAPSNAGSFVRVERVCFGVTVLEALRARYQNERAEFGAETDASELYVHTSRQRRLRVQLVGEDKVAQRQAQIHSLEAARLVGLDVAAVVSRGRCAQGVGIARRRSRHRSVLALLQPAHSCLAAVWALLCMLWPGHRRPVRSSRAAAGTESRGRVRPTTAQPSSHPTEPALVFLSCRAGQWRRAGRGGASSHRT